MRKPKVLFIVHDLHQEDNRFPLGPAYMASVLKQNDCEVQIYCQDIYHYSNEQLAEFLDNNEFDIIGAGFLAARYKETVEELCSVIAAHKKHSWFVLGGPGPSPISEYILEKTGADIVAIGEAEDTIVELVKLKISGGDLKHVKGIAFKKNGTIQVNQRRAPISDLDSIPYPDWSILPMEKYVSCITPYGAKATDIALGIITSRGCLHKCNFCYRMEKGIRVRSISNVLGEMAQLNKNFGVNYFMIFDELFVFSKKRLHEFRNGLSDRGLNIKFSCNARVDIFDEEMAVMLKESGCIFLNFGMESSDQNVLNLMNKKTTVEQNITAAEIALKTGIGLGLNFIWGNIGDTYESLKNNMLLIKRFNTYDQLRTIRPVTPYPGSELYNEAIRRKLLSGPDDFFNRFKNSDLFTVNFTEIPDDRYYELLFEVNKELIMDYFEHTSKRMDLAEKMISGFYDLYFKGKIRFRGARHYEKNKSV